MHAAPPVRMSLAPDRAWHGAVALCAAAAGANLAAWVALQLQGPAATVVATSLAAAAAASLSALWWVRREATTGCWPGMVAPGNGHPTPPRPSPSSRA